MQQDLILKTAEKFLLTFCFVLFLLPPQHTYADDSFIDTQILRLQSYKKKLQKKEAFIASIPKIPCEKIHLEKDDCFPHLPFLRARLIVKDLLDNQKTDQYIYDEEVINAMRTFQKTNHLKPDGIFGGQTCKLINRPLSEDIHLVDKNIERLNKIKNKVKEYEKVILINVAQFRLFAIENQKSALTMKTIVGKIDRKTPIREESLSAVIVNPTWTIPPTIIKTKITDFIKNPKILKEKKFTVIDHQGKIVPFEKINWDAAQKNPNMYRFQQASGKKNALGQIKFMLNNKDAIYLHATNSPSLFQNVDRALSSGCIRLQKPQRLAKWLLEDLGQTKCNIEGKSAETDETAMKCLNDLLKKKMGNKKTYRLKLTKHVPVLLEYLSLWIDDNGFVHKNDPYKRDLE